MRTRLFTSGALTLDLLRCFQAPLPLTAQYVGRPGSSPQLLIVENHATYASALAAARERVAEGAVGFGVGYGAGNQLPKAIGGAAQLDPQPAAIWYFGDLDFEGLRIAADAEAAAVAQGLPPSRPAAPLYQALLSDGVRQSGKKALDETTAWTATAWLDDRLLPQSYSRAPGSHRSQWGTRPSSVAPAGGETSPRVLQVRLRKRHDGWNKVELQHARIMSFPSYRPTC
jgi:hypothetical protein